MSCSFVSSPKPPPPSRRTARSASRRSPPRSHMCSRSNGAPTTARKVWTRASPTASWCASSTRRRATPICRIPRTRPSCGPPARGWPKCWWSITTAARSRCRGKGRAGHDPHDHARGRAGRTRALRAAAGAGARDRGRRGAGAGEPLRPVWHRHPHLQGPLLGGPAATDPGARILRTRGAHRCRCARRGAGDRGVGTGVAADINVGCGRCFYCRKNEVLNCPTMAQIGIHVDGALAEYVKVPASHLVAIPRSTPVEMGALVEPVSCIVRAVKKSRLRLGESVLILGGGPIGNLHLQLARAVGAAPVIVSEPNPGRADWARRSGADIVVSDPSQLAATVREATEGRGADLVIESVGLPVLYEQAFELVRPGGRVLAFGLTDADAQARYHPFKVVLGEIGLQGSVAGMGDDMREAMTLIAHDRVRLAEFAETVYPLARIAEAMDAFVNDRRINKI